MRVRKRLEKRRQKLLKMQRYESWLALHGEFTALLHCHLQCRGLIFMSMR